MLGAAAVVLALGVAAYEALAWFTHKTPTVTELVVRFPKLARVALIGGAVVWALDHFEVWNLF